MLFRSFYDAVDHPTHHEIARRELTLKGSQARDPFKGPFEGAADQIAHLRIGQTWGWRDELGGKMIDRLDAGWTRRINSHLLGLPSRQ